MGVGPITKARCVSLLVSCKSFLQVSLFRSLELPLVFHMPLLETRDLWEGRDLMGRLNGLRCDKDMWDSTGILCITEPCGL
jgi:hypothetical protein